MLGKYSIEVKNKRISFVITVKRSVTIIRGFSGTGKRVTRHLYREERKKMGEIRIPKTIPVEYRQKYADIAALVASFCENHLDEEYTKLCLQALQKLARKRSSPIAKGNNNMWAAGTVYAIAQNCYLVGKTTSRLIERPKYRITSEIVANAFGVSVGGMSEKSKTIREELKIAKDKEEWMSPELRNSDLRILFMRKKRGRK